MPDTRLTHIDEAGAASMVDVGDKPVTERVARARALVRMQPATLRQIIDGDVPKGDVLAVARIAGIQAAKKTSELIPLCHPLALTKVAVDFETLGEGELGITTLCRVSGRTGVEMEAMTAAGVAALTVYDMCKGLEKGITIESVALAQKSGGKSGDWTRSAEAT